MKALQNPEKELRFTRFAHALPFAIGGFILLAAALILYVTSFYREVNPALPHPAWALVPFGLGLLALKLASYMLRHAYVILTPLGMEVLPLIRPQSGMRLIYWHEIHEIEVNDRRTRLTLHFNADQTAGVHLSLRPMGRSRNLLLHAMHERIAAQVAEAKK